jgi:putative DNA primase/helicase
MTEKFAPFTTISSEAIAPHQSDDALALAFAGRYRDELRFVAAWGKWFRWTGTVWIEEQTLLAFDFARQICREVADKSNSRQLASAKTVAAVERLAKADRRIAATIEQWDADPWLLNTPDGVVDLRSGRIRPHQPDDYLTKIAAVAPDPDCPTPLWLEFLTRITGSNAELQDFLQRMAGYGLVGVTTAHALFFLYGTGGNGKGVFLNTISKVARDYATSTDIANFTVGATDKHETGLADLRGARIVTAPETEEGRRWAEAKIKAVTGGDPIKARFMRQDFFQFDPQFTLIISGNHKPGLRSVDEAIRRRFHLVPFTVTIPPDERDPNLADKLENEWPGILAWMIEGCGHWQAIGLSPPAAVASATDAYLESEDAIAAWLDECCTIDPNAWSSSTELYASWKARADRAGEFVGSQKAFVQKLEDRGFEPRRLTRGRGFQGLAVDRSDTSERQWSDR